MPRGIPNKKKDAEVAADQEQVSEPVADDKVEQAQVPEVDSVVEPAPAVKPQEEAEPLTKASEPEVKAPAEKAQSKTSLAGTTVQGPIKVYHTPSTDSKVLVVTGNVTLTGKIVAGMSEVTYMKYGFGIVKGYTCEI